METLENYIAACVKSLEDQADRLEMKMRSADHQSVTALVGACFDKIEAIINTMRARSIASCLEEEDTSADSIAWVTKTLTLKPEHLLGEVSARAIEDYKKLQDEHQAELKRLDELYPSVTEDYFRRAMGIYMDKRRREDDMHTHRAVIKMRHSVLCFKLMKEDELKRLQTELEYMSPEDAEELIHDEMLKIEADTTELLRKNKDFITGYMIQCTEVNAEILQSTYNMNLSDPAEGFGP